MDDVKKCQSEYLFNTEKTLARLYYYILYHPKISGLLTLRADYPCLRFFLFYFYFIIPDCSFLDLLFLYGSIAIFCSGCLPQPCHYKSAVQCLRAHRTRPLRENSLNNFNSPGFHEEEGSNCYTTGGYSVFKNKQYQNMRFILGSLKLQTTRRYILDLAVQRPNQDISPSTRKALKVLFNATNLCG
jgi:hypothetical protein